MVKIAQIHKKLAQVPLLMICKFHRNHLNRFSKIFEYVLIELKIAIILTILLNVEVV